MSVSLDFIKDTMREQDLRFFVIRDSEYRPQYEQMQPVSMDESLRRFDNFFANARNSIYHVFVYKGNQKKVDGQPKGVPYEYEVMLTDSIKDKESVPINGMMGYGSGGQGVPLDNFLNSKDEIMNLKLQVMRLEMEKGQMKDMYERDIERMKADHEKSMSSESRIQGIVGQIAPMFGFGGANSINGISGIMSSMTQEPHQDINNLSTNTMTTQKEKIIAAVNELIKLDPNFPDNLELLVNLAKNKPAVYKQAVSILKAM
jgi:hypothetical protein